MLFAPGCTPVRAQNPLVPRRVVVLLGHRMDRVVRYSLVRHVVGAGRVERRTVQADYKVVGSVVVGRTEADAAVAGMEVAAREHHSNHLAVEGEEAVHIAVEAGIDHAGEGHRREVRRMVPVAAGMEVVDSPGSPEEEDLAVVRGEVDHIRRKVVLYMGSLSCAR